MQCIPQGIVALLMEAQSKGQDSVLTTSGVGTFIDPRVGNGTLLFSAKGAQFVSVEGDQLRYTMPKINVAMFGAPAADREGNIYLRHSSVIAETPEIVKAAKLNGGRVIINVGRVVEKGYANIDIPAESVDAIVYDPNCEQVISVKHKKYWPMLTTEPNMPVSEAIQRVRYINHLLKITPKRTAVDDALARLAATIVASHAAPGIMLNIGVGLPEEVCRVMDEAGMLKKVTVFTESGVIGGIPAPGVFFGAAVCPQKMVSSAEIFRICKQNLDIAVLGVIEADEKGNVNVSKRGDDPRNYVGPGGFIDITGAAKTIVFVTTWMAHAEIGIIDGKIKIIKPGTPKFVPAVSEITFSGEQAIKNGKNVYYVTNVGVFQLTPKGLKLISVMPGIDVERDILGVTKAKIIMPESGQIPMADPAVVTGRDFKLDFQPVKISAAG
jgi:propionate CoA-transferase